MNQQFSFPLNYGLSKAGLPLIAVKVFNHDICLMLDTGSNNNIIDQQIYEHFKDKFEQQSKSISSELLTINGTSKGLTIYIPFTFESIEYSEPFICTEMIEAFDKIKTESGIQIHGILGNQFFLKHGWIINFETVTVCTNK